jgi:hypothetical protein
MNGTANGLYGGDLPNQINTPWIDFSEQSTIVGWSSFTVRRMLYKRIGDIVFFNISLEGTSNSTALTFTIPFVSRLGNIAPASFTTDNGSANMGGFFRIQTNNNTIDCWRPTSSSNAGLSSTWTASGQKSISGNFFITL